MDPAAMIDWTSDETHVFLNPRIPEEERERLQALACATTLAGHLWLATSGTSGAQKLVALSKQALLTSAGAVNRHLRSTAQDVWACVLPSFHVGGLGIHARAFVSGARVVSAPWDPGSFVNLCRSEGVTLASLVPAQVSDLLTGRMEPPAALRAVVVGGGKLAASLYDASCAAGWPLLPSYGMTECCSQIATARPGSPELILLDHFEARTDSEGRLAFRGESLLTGYVTLEGLFRDPKSDGWFLSEDFGFVEGHTVRIEGRSGDFVKIGGESVDLVRLQRILEEVTSRDSAIVAVPDDRLGHVIVLAIAGLANAESARDAFNDRVLPFERIRRIVEVDSIPRTALGKIVRSKLAEMMR